MPKLYRIKDTNKVTGEVTVGWWFPEKLLHVLKASLTRRGTRVVEGTTHLKGEIEMKECDNA